MTATTENSGATTSATKPSSSVFALVILETPSCQAAPAGAHSTPPHRDGYGKNMSR